MINHKTVISMRKVDVAQKEISVAFSDSDNASVILILPSLNDLQELAEGVTPKISIREIAHDDTLNLKGLYSQEYEKLKSKVQRFGLSETYYARLAGFAELLGDFALSEEHLRAGIAQGDKQYFSHRIGCSMLEQGKIEQAKHLYEECDLRTDIKANLRLAYICAGENNIEQTEKYVTGALNIDNLDYASRMFFGAIQLWKGNCEKAVRSFKVAANENPNSEPLFVNLAAAYVGLKQYAQAVNALRKAVAINPLSTNAVNFYADLLLFLDSTELSIKPLKTALQYEQKDDSIWARLARSYYILGTKYSSNEYLNKSYSALKQQLSISSSSSVWNNLALVSSSLGRYPQAQKFYTKAAEQAISDDGDLSLPLYNLLGLLIDQREYKAAHDVAKQLLPMLDQAWSKYNYSWLVYLYYVVSLEAIGKRAEAAQIIESALQEGVDDPVVRVEFFAHITNYFAAVKNNEEQALLYVDKALADISSIKDVPEIVLAKALNNFAFTLIEFGELDKGRAILDKLQKYLYSDPFITATCGLWNIKIGKVENGKELYEKAIGLTSDIVLKNRIKQRMNLELGKAYVEQSNDKLANKYLLKSLKERNGFSYVKKEAQLLLDHKK